MKRLTAEVYIVIKGKKIWVNEFMRQIMKGKCCEEALKLSELINGKLKLYLQ